MLSNDTSIENNSTLNNIKLGLEEKLEEQIVKNNEFRKELLLVR